MIQRGQDRARTSHKSVTRPSRLPITQRILLVAVVLLSGVGLLAAIAHLRVLALIALVLTLAAGAEFWAGVKTPIRQGSPVRIRGRRGSPRKPPDGSGAATAQSSLDQLPDTPETDHEPESMSEQGALSADPGLASPPDRLAGPGCGAAPPISRRSSRVPTMFTMPMPVEPAAPAAPGGRIPDPPVFSGGSKSGQVPWHLPAGAAQSGLAADGARLGDLEVRAASVVGAGHRCEEPADPRQDAYALGRTPDGQFLVIAVADGVSQSPHSDLGARVAVSAATRELVEMLAYGGMAAIDIEELYKVVAGEMLGTGRDRGLADQDICSILIVAVIPTAPAAHGTRQIWASWIGDVSLWIQREGALSRVTAAILIFLFVLVIVVFVIIL